MISKEQVQRIRAAVELAFLSALDAEGLRYNGSSGKYGDTGSITFKFIAVEEDENGVNIASPEAQAFITYATAYGSSPEALGGRIIWMGESYIIEGLRPRARKYPVLARRESDGKRYGLPETALKNIVEYSG